MLMRIVIVIVIVIKVEVDVDLNDVYQPQKATATTSEERRKARRILMRPGFVVLPYTGVVSCVNPPVGHPCQIAFLDCFSRLVLQIGSAIYMHTSHVHCAL